MENISLPKPIPAELPGAVCKQWVKCGKPRCHCARGELHGPYWYRCWRDALGASHKAYVRKGDLEAVRAACAANRVEALAVNAVLDRGRSAVAWLTGARKVRFRGSVVQLIERLVAFEAAVNDLLALACGEGNTPLDRLRAFEVLTPVLLQTCRLPAAPAPPRPASAVERIALGYDPADRTA